MDKKYKCGQVDVQLKDDITIAEEERISEITKEMAATDQKTLAINFTNTEFTELLSIVAEPVNPKEQVNWYEMKRKTGAQIIADFFLQTVSTQMDIQNIFTESTNAIKKHIEGTKA